MQRYRARLFAACIVRSFPDQSSFDETDASGHISGHLNGHFLNPDGHMRTNRNAGAACLGWAKSVPFAAVTWAFPFSGDLTRRPLPNFRPQRFSNP